LAQWTDPTQANTTATVVIAVATVVYVIATIVYVIFTRRMWNVTRENTALTKQMMESHDRPFVAAVRVDHRLSNNLFDVFVELDLENFGGGPAICAQVDWRMEVWDGPKLERTLGFGDEPWSAVVLPKATVTRAGTCTGGGSELNRSRVGVVSGWTITIVAEISYRSITQQTYKTKCQARYHADKKKFVAVNSEAE
jgi:hypothetical protein